MSTPKLTLKDMAVTATQALGKLESPVMKVTLAAYGKPIMSVTHDTSDTFKHTWLRFSAETPELTAHLQAYGWHYSAAKRQGWHRPTDPQSQAFVDGLLGKAQVASKPKQSSKQGTPTEKPYENTQIAPTKAHSVDMEVNSHADKRASAYEKLSDRALAIALEEITAEIARRFRE